jgi:cysteine desulfurase family protein (TIGR01976 family)
VFLDGPGGTQVPRRVIDAIAEYLTACNANAGAPFATSRRSDAVLREARAALADLLGADDPDGLVFGNNMTSLTFAVSRSLARTWKEGDEVLVTRLDHDANFTPWVLAARDAGAAVRFVDVRPEDCTLDRDSFRRTLSPRTRLLAVGLASNSVGTINDVAGMVAELRAVAPGAVAFVDAVHYVPHGPVDVAALGCDLLACSAYKFFGPHVGVLWGRTGLLAALEPYKVRPAPDSLPGRWMTGTQNHEGIAGTLAAVEYLADIGRRMPEARPGETRRESLRRAMSAIRRHERAMGDRLIAALSAVPGLKMYGITDPARSGERVPTVSFTMAGRTPRQIAEHLDRRGLYAYAGNFYALQISERLGLEARGGLLRVGLVHYNTAEEIDRLSAALAELT